MDAIDLLLTRSSNGKLSEPAPDDETLRLALLAASRVPDHAGLHPTRILIIRGAARERLGQVLREALLKRSPTATAAELDKEQKRPLRAPLLLVVTARVETHPKVPVAEQWLSAGSAAHCILLTLQARGYAGIWRTGAPAYDPHVKQALGLRAQDAIIAFVYAGTPIAVPPALTRITPDKLASEWLGVE